MILLEIQGEGSLVLFVRLLLRVPCYDCVGWLVRLLNACLSPLNGLCLHGRLCCRFLRWSILLLVFQVREGHVKGMNVLMCGIDYMEGGCQVYEIVRCFLLLNCELWFQGSEGG